MCSIFPKRIHDVDGVSVNDDVGLYPKISVQAPVENGYSALARSTFRGMINPPTNLSSVADSGFENALELSASLPATGPKPMFIRRIGRTRDDSSMHAARNVLSLLT